MIKDISFLGGGNIDGAQQLTVCCIPIPQTVSNYHAHHNFAIVLKCNLLYEYKCLIPFFLNPVIVGRGEKKT